MKLINAGPHKDSGQDREYPFGAMVRGTRCDDIQFSLREILEVLEKNPNMPYAALSVYMFTSLKHALRKH